jgi:anhydro-N-acetylmuramic acid kinase
MSDYLFLNPKQWFSKPRLICGLMTGTSIDSIDSVLASFSVDIFGKHQFTLIEQHKSDIPDKITKLIHKIIKSDSSISELSFVNSELSRLYAYSVKSILKSANLSTFELDAVGIHGQTVWHEPQIKIEDNSISKGHTLQLGSASFLANIIDVPVVGDFRTADIALGGQGAPLVPIFDYNFFASKVENIIMLNIGGMANITYIPANASEDEVIAFDTGPGNVLIDTFMQKYLNQPYDDLGFHARSGKIIEPLFEVLKQNEFVHKTPPKSTGRELFNEDYISSIINWTGLEKFDYDDFICTLSEFTAWSIYINIKKYTKSGGKLIVSGGGSQNLFIIDRIKAYLPEVELYLTDDFGVPYDAKEALCFAYLAWRTIGRLHGNIPSATGAHRKAILGVIAIP